MKNLGIEIKVETQGSTGAENVLTDRDIEEADGIIIAADKTVDKDRFAGKKVIITGVQDGIRRPKELINQFKDGEVPVLWTWSNKGTSEEEVRVKYNLLFIAT